MPTEGVWTNRCDKLLIPLPHQTSQQGPNQPDQCKDGAAHPNRIWQATKAPPPPAGSLETGCFLMHTLAKYVNNLNLEQFIDFEYIDTLTITRYIFLGLHA